MKKITIIYWTGSGNTEAMAQQIAEGAKENGADVTLASVSNVDMSNVETADVLVLGSPSMGAEVIEESEMEPFVASLEGKLQGKSVALFGSYGWGDGQWIREWAERMTGWGATLVEEPLALPGTPEGTICKEYGQKISS